VGEVSRYRFLQEIIEQSRIMEKEASIVNKLQKRAIKALVNDGFYPANIVAMRVEELYPPTDKYRAFWWQKIEGYTDLFKHIEDTTWELIRQLIDSRSKKSDKVFQKSWWRKFTEADVLAVCDGPYPDRKQPTLDDMINSLSEDGGVTWN
jgi:hypothetical protein